jgi:uncharacterized protein
MTKARIGWQRALALLTLALVQVAGAADAPPAAPPTLHSLWKVEGQSNTVYLLGSIHLLKPEDYPLPLPIEYAFSKAQVVAFETDIGKLQDMDTALKIVAKSALPAGETLQDELTPETYTELTNHLNTAGVPLVMVQQLSPFMAAATLEVMELQKLGLNPDYGVDVHFYKLAQEGGKTIVPFETVDFQIDLLTGFTKAEGELAMKSELKEIDDTQKSIGEMVTAWKTGDSPALAKLLNDGMRDAPAICKRLLTDRSASWVPKIEELLRGGRPAIVIVGAGHLVGDEGVVELLKKRGLKVTQL